jgi:hypothetical protein
MNTSTLILIVSRTPAWVWLILAALVALGLLQARDHVVPRTRVIVLPVVVAALSLWGVAGAFGLHPRVEGPWLAGLLLGLAATRVINLPRQVQALPDGRFAIGGSLIPLALLMAVFFTRYVVNVSLAIAPALKADAGLAAVVAVLYGVPAGLFAGRALRILAQRPADRTLTAA